MAAEAVGNAADRSPDVSPHPSLPPSPTAGPKCSNRSTMLGGTQSRRRKKKAKEITVSATAKRAQPPVLDSSDEEAERNLPANAAPNAAPPVRG
eukprot:4481591-Pleurochrysis_carterae.AAC.1